MRLLIIALSLIGSMIVKTAISQIAPDPNQWAWDAIGLPQAMHFAHFTRPVKVAIIDDGFDIDNPLWASNIAHNPGEIPGNNIDDDHNGKIDDYQGWDFGDNDEEVRPDRKLVEKEYHGTRVLGVFWQVLQQLSAGDLSLISILPIKAVSDLKLNNYLKEGYNGIEYAIQQKADIIICSWSGPMIAPEEKAILAKAQAKGIIIIASAGNFYAMQPQYPGAYPPVIDVAAVNRAGKKLQTSNYGVFVDISAPGDSLLSFDPYKKTADAYLSATSAATPVVGAIVTALRAAWPELSPEAIERLLKNTATPLESRNPLYAGNLGAGLVNIAGIKEALEPGTPSQASGKNPSSPLVYRQAKAYIDLQNLKSKDQIPAAIVPDGKYKNIKFFLQQSTTNPATLPDITLRVFNAGNSRDTIIRRDRLKYPLLLTGDSIYLYRLANRTSTAARSPVWYYYEVTTIDSSYLYCGGSVTNVTGTEGFIEDGSGDNNYTGRNDCKWQITVPEGKKIQLNFEQFDTEPKLDQVYIFNGNSTKDPILAIFSGHKIPPVVKSWGNTALIWFLTNEENNFKGWKLHYKAVD